MTTTYPFIEHHGATQGVTGSCHQLWLSAKDSLLIDCGLFQGVESSVQGAGAHSLAIEFKLDSVKALIATHVHIDHIGRLPWLIAAGFKGPVYCTEPSAMLMPTVLEDAFLVGVQRDRELASRFVGMVQPMLRGQPYAQWIEVIGRDDLRCRIRFKPAGHILGSAWVECDVHYPNENRSKRIVFSGDLGAPHAPLLPAPGNAWRADTVVLESTYGDRLHEDRRSRRQRFQRVLEHALADGGTVLIPAFSIGRTQELLYELEDIIHSCTAQTATPPGSPGFSWEPGASAPGRARREPATGADASPGSLEHLLQDGDARKSRAGADAPASQRLPTNWPTLPIILDAPLASRFTALYRQLKPYWDQEALKRIANGRKPLAFDNLLTVETHAQHLAMVNRLAHTRQPAIVITGNGMCSAGRIVNYLKAMLGDPRHDVVFVGYQAKGTPGHAIQQHGPRGGYVSLEGERIQIKAGVHTLGGYSAHADQKGLVNFITRMRHWPSEVRLVHGDPEAKEALAGKLRQHAEDKNIEMKIIIP
ncbi:MBL fold metallo-hydrolase RNA specificity domain-containing protein [Pseudomonas jilinensis]|uniref:MBL fold hydrolase n=1 Tax=Pseudomonas jilinensis TaxID=2078689 RepID=A0A396S0C1_9PSED|nr:MBL fold metallo-hydrolase RNA specificity domain-containing protein [Pseudomonas jilinensis]RHW20203.1 MBL fold hydrolase [Pseudomonas jilinensis]